MAREFLPDRDAERERYLQHNNRVDDPDYRAFLSRLWDRVRPLLAPGSVGLDYGSGPGPALLAMMREDGFDVRAFDPIFAPDLAALESTYDFVVCTETAEHFHRPGAEFLRLDGLLAVMTSVIDDPAAFGDWHYRRDPTHVSFYGAETMVWIADRMGWRLSTPARDVAVFSKPAG